MVSRQHVVLLSSARDNQLDFETYEINQRVQKTPENQGFPGFSYTLKHFVFG